MENKKAAKLKCKNISLNFERNLQMMNYYQQEYLYRHKHFWDLIVKLFILDVTVSLLPICKNIFGIEAKDISSPSLIIFSVLGTIIAIASFCILYNEARRMTSVKNAAQRIQSYLGEKNKYPFYNSKQELIVEYNTNDSMSTFVWTILIGLLILELAMNCYVFIFILKDVICTCK